MPGTFSTSRTVATGAVLGAIILGLAGRFATAALAVALGVSANLSVGGLIESTIVGSIWGAVGAIILIGIDRGEPPVRARGVINGVVTFLASAGWAWILGHGPDLGLAEGRATTVTVAAIFVLFGIALSRAIPYRREP